jgi:hypothetical protein
MKVLGVKNICIYIAICFSSNLNGQSLNLFLKQQEIKVDTTTFSILNNKFVPGVEISKYPIFCRWEELLQAKSKIAVRFRLGNLDTVNKLEGK